MTPRAKLVLSASARTVTGSPMHLLAQLAGGPVLLVDDLVDSGRA